MVFGQKRRCTEPVGQETLGDTKEARSLGILKDAENYVVHPSGLSFHFRNTECWGFFLTSMQGK